MASFTDKKSGGSTNSLIRVGRYVLFRVTGLLLTIVVAVYLVIMIANMGGYVDDIRRAQIKEAVGMELFGIQDDLIHMSLEERRELERQMIQIEEERLGLNRPFIIRSFIYLKNALTLDLGRAEQLTSDRGSRMVRNIILDRLPTTLILFVTAYLINFFLSVSVGLFLSRNYGNKLDKAIIALAPTSAAPAWFYAIFLILIFAAVLGILPFGGIVKAPPPQTTIAYLLSVLKHLILPVTAILISTIFILIFNWRTFFLIYSSEDYVEMAKAKGLSNRAIERKYILRPTLPPILTSFALALIYQWQGAIILEGIFNWPGVGQLFFQAISLFDIPIIVSISVLFAYLLALTVFFLDIVYAILDPRVRVGGGSS